MPLRAKPRSDRRKLYIIEAIGEARKNCWKYDYVIEFDCPEYTSLCPVTGQPDFGHIVIRYIPDQKCIESKSLKLFLYSCRNASTFHEEAVNSILDAVVNACSPRAAEVVGKFRPRGGIAINVTARYGDPLPA